MTTSSEMRVLLPLDASEELAGRAVTIKNKSFKIIDYATPDVIERARTFIQNGETAGIVNHAQLTPQAIFFDMDATVIAEESLVEVAKAAGREHEVAALTAKAMAGGMDFATSLRMRLQILKGTPRKTILGVKPDLNPGMRDLAGAMITRGVKLFLVSGGFMEMAEPVANDLGFHSVKANRFAWNGDLLAGDVEGDIVGAEGKRDAVLDWCRIYHLNPKLCVAVGDGANDRLMMGICGLAVGFEPKQALWNTISVLNGTGDHRLLLELLSPLTPRYSPNN